MIKLSKYFMIIVFAVLTQLAFAQTNEVSIAKVYNDGLALLKEKNYQEGYEKMVKAVDLATEAKDDKVLELAKKNGSIAAYNLGNEFKKSKKYVEALSTYNKGIELNENYTSNYVGRALTLRELGKSQEAVEAMLEAGSMYEKAGKIKKANTLYKKASVIVGKLYTGDKLDEAITAGEAFLAVKKYANVAYYMGRVYEKKGDFNKALDYANQVFEYAGDKVEDKFYMLKGGAHEGLSQTAEAVTEFKKVTGEKYKKQAEFKINKLEGK